MPRQLPIKILFNQYVNNEIQGTFLFVFPKREFTGMSRLNKY